MPDRERAQVIDPFTATADGERGPFPFDLYERQLLAQGDSWFSVGAIPPTRRDSSPVPAEWLTTPADPASPPACGFRRRARRACWPN